MIFASRQVERVMLYKRCLNLSGEYMTPIKPDTLQAKTNSHVHAGAEKGQGIANKINVDRVL